MNIIEHGKWQLYKPDKRPEGIPPSVAFLRRESDGMDWYTYSRDPLNFKADSVKFLATHQDIPSGGGGWMVGAAVRDVSMLFPINAVVGEIDDYDGPDPQRDLGMKIWDMKSRMLRPWPKPPGKRKNPMELAWELEKRIDGLQKRLEKLERGNG